MLGALFVLGLANTMRAVYLWGEFVVSRTGGTTFCGLSNGAAEHPAFDDLPEPRRNAHVY